MDPSSFANFRDVRTTKMHLSLQADFERSYARERANERVKCCYSRAMARRVLAGYVDLTLQVLTDGVQQVVLDTRDLAIQRVTTNNDSVSLPVRSLDSNTHTRTLSMLIVCGAPNVVHDREA